MKKINDFSFEAYMKLEISNPNTKEILYLSNDNNNVKKIKEILLNSEYESTDSDYNGSAYTIAIKEGKKELLLICKKM